MHACVLSCFIPVQLCVILWTAACQTLLSMDFPGKNIGVVCGTSSRGSSWPRMNPHLSCLLELAGGFFTTSATWKSHLEHILWFSCLHAFGFFLLPVTYHCISSQLPIPSHHSRPFQSHTLCKTFPEFSRRFILYWHLVNTLTVILNIFSYVFVGFFQYTQFLNGKAYDFHLHIDIIQ